MAPANMPPSEPERVPGVTRAVILASGMGSRIQAGDTPKPLVRMAGLSLIERSITALERAGFDDVVVVTGHRGDEVDVEALTIGDRRGIPVRVVRNDRFAEGNGLAVWAARHEVDEQPFVLVMADHVFSPSFLERLRRVEVGADEVVVGVDRYMGASAGVDAGEATRVRLEDDQVTGIGKGLGEYDALDVGAFACSPALLPAIRQAERAGDSSLSGAVQVLATAGRARALDLRPDEWWFDVDTPSDRRSGSRFLARRTGKPLDGAMARVNRQVSQRLLTPMILAVAPRATPNQVSLVALAIAALAAVVFALRSPVAGALLVALASIVDGCDGEIARLTHRGSAFGGFLDPVFDRVSDALVITGATAYLAADPQLRELFGDRQADIAIVVGGLATLNHLVVSYIAAKADLDLGHRFSGSVVGGGRGRDLRLLLITIGGLLTVLHPASLLVGLAAVAVVCCWIIVVRLRASWWAEGHGAPYTGVDAIVLAGGWAGSAVAEMMAARTELPVYVVDTADEFEMLEAGGEPRRPLVLVGDGRLVPQLRRSGVRIIGLLDGGSGGRAVFRGSGIARVASIENVAAGLARAASSPLRRE